MERGEKFARTRPIPSRLEKMSSVLAHVENEEVRDKTKVVLWYMLFHPSLKYVVWFPLNNSLF